VSSITVSTEIRFDGRMIPAQPPSKALVTVVLTCFPQRCSVMAVTAAT